MVDYKMKLCLVYNFAPKYREAIFRLIDENYDCDWYFGHNTTDIKGLDLSVLKNTTIIKNQIIFRSHLYFQRNVVSLLWKKEYQTFFMLGELYCLSTWLFVIVRKLFFPNKKVYFWSHGWYGRENKMKKILKKIFFNLADGTFLYGNYAKNLMMTEGFNPNKLFVIHNSLLYDKQVELRKLPLSDTLYQHQFGNNHKNIIFIGRLTKSKRLDLLIDAIQILKDNGYHYNLIIVGNGSEKEILKEQVLKCGLNESVWFFGACYDEPENARLIYNADLCVSPGNVGLTAIHSMVYGTPVITHSSYPYQGPEFEAIRPCKTGDFFEYNNLDSMVNCIQNWFVDHDDTKRDEIREACFREIDTFWTPQFQLDVIKQFLK